MQEQEIQQWTKMIITPDGLSQLAAFYAQAQQIGSSTSLYIQLLIAKGKMEKRIIDGCRAIIRLGRIYGPQRLEDGCKRALMGTRYNYTTIKTIMENGLDLHEVPCTPEAELSKQDHENLRGSDFFN